MSTYIQLVNKVIQESGMEQDELTSVTWNSPEAGRRLYPRIKRAVAEAWKAIQMDRNEWEFSTAELTTLLYPRIVADPTVGGILVGATYRGQDSGLLVIPTVVQDNVTVLNEMSGTSGDTKLVDFVSEEGGSNRAKPGERFVEVIPSPGATEFIYLGRGSYRLSEISEFAREPHWSTFIAYQDELTPTPVRYIPWENWVYKELTYTTSTRSAPSFVSQDYNGNLTFYPQTLSPFSVNFVCDLAPQTLMDADDTPSLKLLPAELHEWIAWEALATIARYDKNPDLLAYATSWIKRYKRKAERTLMPMISYRESRYNRYGG